MRVADVHTLAEGALTGPGMPGHGLVDDDDERRVGTVVQGEGPAFEQRDAHSLKVITINDCEGGEFLLPLADRLALNGVGSLPRGAGSWERVGEADGDNSRPAREPVDNSMVEDIDRSIGGVVLDGKLISRNDDVIGTKAGIDGAHLLEAAQEGAGYGQQHQSDSDFRYDQG